MIWKFALGLACLFAASLLNTCFTNDFQWKERIFHVIPDICGKR
jgi:hypothetical protein